MNVAEFIGVSSVLAVVGVAFVLGAAPVFVVRLIVAVYPKDDPRRPELIASAAKEAKRGLRNVPAHWYLLGHMFAGAVLDGLPVRWRRVKQRLRVFGMVRTEDGLIADVREMSDIGRRFARAQATDRQRVVEILRATDKHPCTAERLKAMRMAFDEALAQVDESSRSVVIERRDGCSRFSSRTANDNPDSPCRRCGGMPAALGRQRGAESGEGG